MYNMSLLVLLVKLSHGINAPRFNLLIFVKEFPIVDASMETWSRSCSWLYFRNEGTIVAIVRSAINEVFSQQSKLLFLLLELVSSS